MKKSVIASCMIALFLFSNTALAAFPDVTDETLYKTAIDWMADNGVIEGYPDGTFKPDQCVNRAEFLKMLYLTLESDIYDIPSGTTYLAPFSDVIPSEWYAQYIQYALQQETIEGYPDGTFKPGQCVNRVEAVKMATLEFHDGVIENIPNYYGQFADEYSDISEDAWYYQYLVKAFRENAVGLEHVTGEPNVDLAFYPGDSMSREEVAEMLYRMKTIKDNNLTQYQDTYSPDNIVGINYSNLEYGLSFNYPNNWTIVKETTIEIGTGTQLQLELSPGDNTDAVLGIYTPPREIGYEDYTIESGFEREISNLTLSSAQLLRLDGLGRTIAKNIYYKDAPGFFNSIEFTLAANGDVFDGYLPVYYMVLDSVIFN